MKTPFYFTAVNNNITFSTAIEARSMAAAIALFRLRYAGGFTTILSVER